MDDINDEEDEDGEMAEEASEKQRQVTEGFDSSGRGTEETSRPSAHAQTRAGQSEHAAARRRPSGLTARACAMPLVGRTAQAQRGAARQAALRDPSPCAQRRASGEACAKSDQLREDGKGCCCCWRTGSSSGGAEAALPSLLPLLLPASEPVDILRAALRRALPLRRVLPAAVLELRLGEELEELEVGLLERGGGAVGGGAGELVLQPLLLEGSDEEDALARALADAEVDLVGGCGRGLGGGARGAEGAVGREGEDGGRLCDAARIARCREGKEGGRQGYEQDLRRQQAGRKVRAAAGIRLAVRRGGEQ